MKILITQAVCDEAYAPLLDRFDCIIPISGAFTKEEILASIGDCDALLSMFNFCIDKEIIDAGRNLRIISNFGVGFNNIDVAYATSRGIVVCNTPDPVVEPTAEMAFGLMLDCVRGISAADRRVRSGKVVWGVMENLARSVCGKTVGIVGFGRIGQAIARRALASGMNVVYYSRHRVDEAVERKYNARFLPFEELLSVSDVVSLNVPYTGDTHHLIDEKALAIMRESSFLINTARGAVVDEKALIEALRNNRIAGAGLDVFEFEPEISEGLLSLDNVVLSPHCGTATIDARIEMGLWASKNIINFLEGGVITRVN